MADVPRSLQSWASTIQTVALTADVFQLFIKSARATHTYTYMSIVASDKSVGQYYNETLVYI